MLNEVNFKIKDNILPCPTTDVYCGTSDQSSPKEDHKKLMIILKCSKQKNTRMIN